MNKIEIDGFLSTDALRPGLCKPIHQGEFTYATNGSIIIRVPRREGEETPPVTRADSDNPVPDCAKILVSVSEFDGPWLRLVDCGAGEQALEECLYCDDGMKECDTCGHLDGCPNCEGTSEILNKRPVLFGRNDVAFWLYALIKELPGAKFGDAPLNTIIPFRFDGGIGGVIPQKKQDELPRK